MIKFRLYIPPVILGFVIVPLLVWPTVIVLAVLIFTLTFLAEIIFSFPLLVVRISLQELQLELMVEYALFFSVMAGIGWQFSRRTPPELKNRLHCWLVFSPVYFWLILSNFILYISPEKSALLENIRNFFLTFVWLPLNFPLFGRSLGLILSARLVHSLVLHWDIIAIGAEKIETRGRSGAIG
ncbi:putative membrane protein [Escherichia coli TW07509]|nr:putative membrane protein [Escherichia coli TW07509]